MPEKSGIAAGPTAGPTVCPKTGVAAATAIITSEPKSRHLCMTTSLSCSSVTLAPNRPGSADFVPFEIGVTRLRGRRLRRGIEIVDDAMNVESVSPPYPTLSVVLIGILAMKGRAGLGMRHPPNGGAW
jgi:hypothetical protein